MVGSETPLELPPRYLHQNKQFIEFLLLNGNSDPTYKSPRRYQPIGGENVGGQPIRALQSLTEIFATPCGNQAARRDKISYH